MGESNRTGRREPGAFGAWLGARLAGLRAAAFPARMRAADARAETGLLSIAIGEAGWDAAGGNETPEGAAALSALLERLPPSPSPRSGRVIVLASALDEVLDGVAFALARKAHRRAPEAILVDARMGAGTHGEGSSPPGLTEALLGRSPMETLIVRSLDDDPAVLGPGTPGLPASSLLSLGAWPSVLRRLRLAFRTTIVIGPRIGTDGFTEVARPADGLVLVADRGLPPDELVDRADLAMAVAPKATVLVALV